MSPDLQWAALSGIDLMVVIDSTGRIAWSAEHPSFGDADGDAVPACAIFSPDGSELWAFAPTLDASSDDGWVDDAERWVIDASKWHVIDKAESRYRGITNIIADSARGRLGFADFNGHEIRGLWTTWDSGTEAVITRGEWFPWGISTDGDRWVGGSWHDIVVGDFAGTEIRLNEDGDWDHWEFTPGACFLGQEHVLVAGRHSDHEHRHLLFRSDTLRPAGHIAYPPEFLSEQDNRFLYGDSDGTWLTLHIPDRARPGEGRLRRWTLVDSLET